MESLAFLFSSFIFSKVVFPKGNIFFFLLRSLGMLSSVMVVFSLYFSYLSIPLNLYSFSVLFLVLSFVALKFFPRKKIDLKKFFSFKNFCFCNWPTFFLVGAASLGVAFFYFDFSFSLPKFISVDASVHYYMERYVLENERLIFTSRDLVVEDTDNYPFGTSVLAASFSRLVPFLSQLEKFQIFNVLVFFLISVYFILFLQKHFPFRSKLLFFSFCSFIVFGFFFNMLIMGFTSQIVGLFLLLFFSDAFLYLENFGSFQKNFFIALALSAILFTYIYWLPVALIFIFLKSLTKEKSGCFSFVKNFIQKNSLIFLIFVLFSLPYIISLYNFGILRFSGSDGATYKVFLLNFIVFVPFIIQGLFLFGEKSSAKNPFFLFVSSSLLYFLLLFFLYSLTNSVSDYTQAKVFYLVGPILYFLTFFAIDKIYFNISVFRKIFFSSLIFLLILSFIFMPFFKKKEYFSEKRKDSLRMNLWGANGRVFDIFYFNAKSAKNTNKEGGKLNINQDKKDFIEKIPFLLEKKGYPQRIATVADPNISLWFYSLSWIWPREKIDGSTSIWEKEIFDYEKWKKQRTSPYLIILDTQPAKEWMERNNFNIEDFDVICEKKGNYLLKLKEADTP